MATPTGTMSNKDIEDDIKRQIWSGSNDQQTDPNQTEANKGRRRFRNKYKSPAAKEANNYHPGESQGATSGGTGSQSRQQKTVFSASAGSASTQNRQTNRNPPQGKGGQQQQGGAVRRGSKEQIQQAAIEAELELDSIFYLKRKPSRFPTAAYYCRLCDYHCDNLAVCYRHRQDNRHKRLKKNAQTDMWLRSLPPPQHAHIAVLGQVLDDIAQQTMCTPQQLQQRRALLGKLQDHLAKHIKGIKLSLFGSTASGFALKSSDVNIDVTNASPKLLLTVQKLLQSDTTGEFMDVEKHFSDKVPHLSFAMKSEDGERQHCQLCCGNEAAVQIADLLALYCQFNPVTAILHALFREWAKIVRIDDQSAGTLPTYVLTMMVVYYMQQIDALPVLHEEGSAAQRKGGGVPGTQEAYMADPEYLESLKKSSKYASNGKSVVELFIGLLRFYGVTFDLGNFVVCIRQHKPLTRSERRWSNKKLAIEDPFSRKRNVGRSLSHCYVYEYIIDRLRAAYVYFSVPQTPLGPLFMETDSGSMEKILVDSMKEVDRKVNDREGGESSRQSIVDDSVDGIDMGLEQLDLTGNKAYLSTSLNLQSTDKLKSMSIDELASEISDAVINNAVQVLSTQQHDEAATAANIPDSKTPQTPKPTTNSVKSLQAKDIIQGSPARPSADTNGLVFDISLAQQLREDQLCFEFSEDTLLDEQKNGPAVMCSLCQKEGHLKSSCPDDMLPPLEPLPQMTNEHLGLLDRVLSQVPADFEPTEKEVAMREQVKVDLENFIRDNYNKDTCLSLFGSSMNGFGFQYSDLDISMVFANRGPEGLNLSKIVEEVSEILRRHPNLTGIHAITTAKVPIVKFQHFPTKLDGDISLYNTLAQHNTFMLRMYSKIDPRVKALGYTMKVFAKICEICDASRGSLSSYAYTLMVIYFLQQRNPPVIPVLQELYEGKKPEKVIEGWNAWYYGDINSVPKVWSHWGSNTESLAELWTGLLRFYTEEFQFLDHVVSIRSSEPITRFEKLWNGKVIAIEDPFDLNHNLGGALSRKMNMYIMKALRNGRQLFCTPIQSLPQNFSSFQDYLFDPQLLTKGAVPPNDRGCRVCQRIGHFAKDCPVVLARTEKKRQKEQERQMERKQPEKDRRNIDGGSGRDDNNSNAAEGGANMPSQRGGGGGRGRGRGGAGSFKPVMKDNTAVAAAAVAEDTSYTASPGKFDVRPFNQGEIGGGGRGRGRGRGNAPSQGFVVTNSKYNEGNGGVRPKQPQPQQQRWDNQGYRERRDSDNQQGYRERRDSDNQQGYRERRDSDKQQGYRERRDSDNQQGYRERRDSDNQQGHVKSSGYKEESPREQKYPKDPQRNPFRNQGGKLAYKQSEKVSQKQQFNNDPLSPRSLAVHRGKFTVTLDETPPDFLSSPSPSTTPRSQSSMSVSDTSSGQQRRRQGQKNKKKEIQQQQQLGSVDSFIAGLKEETQQLDETINALQADIKIGLKFVSKCRKQDRLDEDTQREYSQTQKMLQKKQQQKKQLYKASELLKETLDYMSMPKENVRKVHNFEGFLDDLLKETARVENAMHRLQQEIEKDFAFTQQQLVASQPDVVMWEQKLSGIEADLPGKQQELHDKRKTLTLMQDSLDYMEALLA